MKLKLKTWVYCLGGELDGKILEYVGPRAIPLAGTPGARAVDVSGEIGALEYVECNLVTARGSARRFYALSTLTIKEVYERADAHKALG